MVDQNMVQKKYKQIKYRRFLSNLKNSSRGIVSVRKQTLNNVSYLNRFKNLNKTVFGSKACTTNPGQFFYFLRSLWLRKFINTFMISGGKKKSAKIVMKTIFFLKFDEFLNNKKTFKRFFKISKNLLKIHSLKLHVKKRINFLIKEKISNSISKDASIFWDFGWRPYSWYLKNSIISYKKLGKFRGKLPVVPRVKSLNKFSVSGWYWIVSILDLLRIPVFSKIIYVGYTPKIASKILSWAQQFSLVFTWFRKVLVSRKASSQSAVDKLFYELDYSLDSSLSLVRSKRDVMLEVIESARKYNHFRWSDKVSKVKCSKFKKKIFLWYSRGIGKLNPYRLDSLKTSLFFKLRKKLNKHYIKRKNNIFSKLYFYTSFSSNLKLFPFFLDTFKYFFFDNGISFNKQSTNILFSKSILNKKSFRKVGVFQSNTDKLKTCVALKKQCRVLNVNSSKFFKRSWYNARVHQLKSIGFLKL